MNFPSSPSNGQIVTVNGIQYVYNSTYGSWTRTQQTDATIGGNLTVTGNLSVAGNTTFINSQTITTTDTLSAPAINAGTIGNSGATFTGASSTLTGNLTVGNISVGGNANVSLSTPLINLTQTWGNTSTTFTSLLMNVTNVASGGSGTSKIFDFQLNGVSQFALDTVWLRSTKPILGSWAWFQTNTSTILLGAAGDTILSRGAAAATLQLGAANAASPLAQTLRVQSVSSGTADTAGNAFIIQGSGGTGTGVGGSIAFQVAPANVSSSTTQNTLTNAHIIYGNTDSSFTGNVFITGTTNLTGAVTAASFTTSGGGQHIGYHTGAIGANTPNTGAFTTVTASGNITAQTANVYASNIIANTGLYGPIATNAQTNITSLGTLTGLTLSGSLNGQTINGTSLLGTTIGNTASAINGNLANFSAVYAGTIGNTGANFTGNSIAVSGNSSASNFVTSGSLNTSAVYINSTTGNYNVLNISGAALPAYGTPQTWSFFTNNTALGGSPSFILFPDSSTQTTAYPGNSTTLSLTTFNATTVNATNMYATTIGNTASAINGNLITASAVYAGTIGNSGATFTGTTLVTSGNIYGGGNIVAASGTTSTSTTTGALVVSSSGGIGVGGNIYIGSNANVAGNFNTVSNIGIKTSDVRYTITIPGNNYIGFTGVSAQNAPVVMYTDTSDNGYIGFVGGSGKNFSFRDAATGGGTSVLTLSNVTNGHTMTGRLQITPGATTQAGLVINGVANQTANLFYVTASGGTAGALFNVGPTGNIGMGIAAPTANLHLVGNANIYSPSASSTSTTTGGLVVTGGAGITGNLYVSGNLSIAGNTTFINTQTITTTDTIAAPAINAGTIGNSGATFTGASSTLTGAAVAASFTTSGGGQHIGYLTGAIGANTPNTGVFTTVSASSNISAFASLNVISNIGSGNFVANTGVYSPAYYWANGTVFSSGGGSGTPGGSNTMVQFNDGGTFAGSTFLQYNKTSGNLVSNSTTTSTSTTTGAIVVGGGVGIGGNLNVAGNIVTSGTNGNISGVYNFAATGNVSAGGFYWSNGSPLASSKFTVSNTAPSTAGPGDTWYQANTDILFMYINDASSSFWMDIVSTPNTFSNLTAGNATVTNLTSGTAAPIANAAYNLGTTTSYWNTVYGVSFVGTSTTARYADLAENYASDVELSPGDVVVFGGESEVTTTSIYADTRVAGIVSTNPAYLMNSGLENGYPIAMTGRVPCRVLGPVKKGDLLVTSNISGAACVLDKSLWQPGCVIGKSLENIDTYDEKIIEVAVGRF